MYVPVAQEIKSRVTMRDICERYGIPVDRTGKVVCVFHADKTPSMKIYPGDRGFHCFGCGASGTSIDFVMMYFSLSYKEAIRKINDDFNLGLELDKKLSETERERLSQNALIRNKVRKMAEERLKGLETAYNEAEKKVAQLHSIINKNDPRRIRGGLISDEYAETVKMLPIAEYNAEQAESELYTALHIGENRY